MRREAKREPLQVHLFKRCLEGNRCTDNRCTVSAKYGGRAVWRDPGVPGGGATGGGGEEAQGKKGPMQARLVVKCLEGIEGSVGNALFDLSGALAGGGYNQRC
jgi:hypothetical protein